MFTWDKYVLFLSTHGQANPSSFLSVVLSAQAGDAVLTALVYIHVTTSLTQTHKHTHITKNKREKECEENITYNVLVVSFQSKKQQL